jgi:hypothetical protein
MTALDRGSSLRIEATLKVTGAARYAAETAVAGLLHAALVVAPIASGRVQRIDAVLGSAAGARCAFRRSAGRGRCRADAGTGAKRRRCDRGLLSGISGGHRRRPGARLPRRRLGSRWRTSPSSSATPNCRRVRTPAAPWQPPASPRRSKKRRACSVADSLRWRWAMRTRRSTGSPRFRLPPPCRRHQGYRHARYGGHRGSDCQRRFPRDRAARPRPADPPRALSAFGLTTRPSTARSAVLPRPTNRRRN